MRPLALALSILALPAGAATLESVVVDHARGDFSVDAVMRIEAPVAAVRAALTDYAALGALSPSILESRVVRVEGDATFVYTRSRACAGWFCREVRRTERIVPTADGLRGELATGPGLPPGNISHSATDWRIEPIGAGATRVTLHSTLDPAFWVPPLVGPPIVKSGMKREAELLARGLERAAQARAATPRKA